MVRRLYNPHAGEILKFEFLDKLNMSQNALAKAIDVPVNHIDAIIRGKQSITTDTDLRLCTFFGLSEEFFLRLQLAYELIEAKQDLIKQ